MDTSQFEKNLIELGSRPNGGKTLALDRDASPPAIRSLWTLAKYIFVLTWKSSLCRMLHI